MSQQAWHRFSVETTGTTPKEVVPAPPFGTARIVKYLEFFNKDNKPHAALIALNDGVSNYVVQTISVAAGISGDAPVEHGAYVLKSDVSLIVALAAGAITESHVTAHCIDENDPLKAARYGLSLELTENPPAQVVIATSPVEGAVRIIEKISIVNTDNTPCTYEISINDGSTVWMQEGVTLGSGIAAEFPHRGGAFVMEHGDTLSIEMAANASTLQSRVTTHWVDEPLGAQ